MRVGHVQQSRPAYYDRNPIAQRTASRYLALSPTNFVDITYTVPTGKKAYLQAASAMVLRATVATTPGRCAAIAEYVRVDFGIVDICEAGIRANVVGEKSQTQFGGVGLLLAGEKFQTEVQDSDTGGTVDFMATGWLVEFDA